MSLSLPDASPMAWDPSDLRMTVMAGSVVSCAPVMANLHTKSVVIHSLGSSIRCICAHSGQLLGKYEGHSSAVISIKTCENLSERLKTPTVASLDRSGALHFWSLGDHQTLYTFASVKSAADFHIVDSGVIDGNDQWTQTEVYIVSPGEKKFAVQRLCLATQTLQEAVASSTRNAFAVFSLQGSGNGVISTVVVSTEKTKVLFQLLPAHQSLVIDLKEEITCLASPTNSLVAGSFLAVGTKRGRIELLRDVAAMMLQLWKGVGKESSGAAAIAKDAVRTTLHWHAHAVRSLAFSHTADLLYSSGEESVLVFWSTNRSNGGSPLRFLPRLGASIAHVSVSPSSANVQVLVSTRDNSLRIVNPANAEVTWSWQSLDLPSRKSDDLRLQAMFAHDASQPVLLSNGSPGTLQLFNTVSRSLDSQLKVVNHVRVDSGAHSFPPSVSLYSLSEDSCHGYAIATVDEQRGEDLDVAYSLKFWQAAVESDGDKKDWKYSLISQVNAPHAQSPILALVVRAHRPATDAPYHVVACTSSQDGFVKVWRRSVHLEGDGKEQPIKHSFMWRCSYSLRMHDGPVQTLALSADLSTLVVAAQSLVSFWDPRTATKIETIPSAGQLPVRALYLIEPRQRSSLGGGNGQAFLVTTTDHEVSVFNMLTAKPVWTFRADRVRHVCVAENEDCVIPFAGKRGVAAEAWLVVVAQTDGDHTDKVFFFSPLTAEPLATFANPARLPVHSCCFAPGSGLVVVSHGSLFTLSSGAAVMGVSHGARVKASTLPVVGLASDAAGKITSAQAVEIPTHALVASAHTSKHLLSTFLAEHTQDLARPSEISADFLQSALRTVDGSAPAPAAPSSSAVARPLSTDARELGVASAVEAPRGLDLDIIHSVFERLLPVLFAQVSEATAKVADKEKTVAAKPVVAPHSVARRTRAGSRLEEDSAAEDSAAESLPDKTPRKRSKRT